ncbi:MAG: sucrose-phosphate phosphatase [Cyanobacteria bacterium CRU_2_1]|nr:sucrose-phosphate phosphatase [Cyanobacteria bacterium RU_5_0]NJR59433.1 sucrose-phosphate phosphatase [Cyanobacteria bacterium CRU_2_1]
MKFLLVTDLDNTLVGDDRATFSLNQKLLSLRDEVCLVYATGRSYPSAQRLKHERQLLEPDYWITGVGTEIYRRGKSDQTWASQLSHDWDRRAIVSITQSFRDLVFQPASEQNPRKISFYLDSENADAILSNLQAELDRAGLSAQVVFSSNQDVDILPRRGDKGLAMTYLREQLQVRSDATLVCGDSGNDISLFQQSTLGVIVGNARSELLNWHRQHGQSYHYRAQANYAWGILEALVHFNLWDADF